MNAIAVTECATEFEIRELRRAANLQDLFDVMADILSRYDIDHAVLYSIPNASQSLVPPLLPLSADMRSIINRSVRDGIHPAESVGRGKADIRTIHVRRDLMMACDPVLLPLLAALRVAGIRHLYEVPLAWKDGEHFVLEFARRTGEIDDDDLAELRLIGQELPEKLPGFMTGRR
ncbi:MAG: hypothetical protein KKB37_04495 [Alphaproteobacteria bacterium]|nr:hypothetical protein [Alphaproteobacteria bacterium]